MLCLSWVLMLLVSQMGQAASLQEIQMGKVQMLTTAAGHSFIRRRKPMFSGGKSMKLDFGGEMHGRDNEGDNLRPEVVKTKVCDDSFKCTECTEKSSCWHGVAQGRLQLDVPANSPHNIFTAEVWASCANGKGNWAVVVWKNALQNGFLNVYFDGSLFKKVENKRFAQQVKMPVVKDSRVTAEFVRTDTGSMASGYITMRASGVDEYVDSCMGTQVCLKDLGDGTPTAFLFRSSNPLQLRCLSATTATQRSDVSDHCEPFVTCLSEHPPRKENLEALLKASLGTSGLLAENSRRTNVKKLDDAEGCIDPSVADAESWACECMDEMTASCDGANEECFNGILCANTNVCESWKGDHCAEFLIAKQNISIKASKEKSVALMRRGAQRVVAIADKRAAGEAGTRSDLDSALDGKCAV